MWSMPVNPWAGALMAAQFKEEDRNPRLGPKREGFKALAAQPFMREPLRENAGTRDASASWALDASRS
jgi:hypothetical protein